MVAKTVSFWQRWKFSLCALVLCVGFGTYTLFEERWQQAGRERLLTDTEKQASLSDLPNQSSLLSVHHWDTLRGFDFHKGGRKLYARFKEEPWTLHEESPTGKSLFLSDFEQALLQRTAEQLRVFNVQRLLLENPTVAQKKDMHIHTSDGNSALPITVHLQGTVKQKPVQTHLLLGRSTPTGTGFYVYHPDTDMVYLGYINVPEALTRLLEHA